jgi:hypothetical protein
VKWIKRVPIDLSRETSGLKPGRSETATTDAEYRSQEILTTAEEIIVERLAKGPDFEVDERTQDKIYRQWNLVKGWVTDPEAQRLRGLILNALRTRYPGPAGCDSVLTSMERGQWFVCDRETGHAIGRIPEGIRNCTAPEQRICGSKKSSTGSESK